MWSTCARSRISRAVVGVSRATTWQSTSTAANSVVPASSRMSPVSLPHLTGRSLSSYSPSPLDAFRDSVDRETRANQPVGRSWSVQELRRKSYDDLHKLWYVFYMERNMLMTEQQLSRRRQLILPQPQRLKKVQKSMGAIKQVLGERKRRKIADYKTNQMEQALQDESEDMENLEFSSEK
jgi:hypothetical protein